MTKQEKKQHKMFIKAQKKLIKKHIDNFFTMKNYDLVEVYLQEPIESCSLCHEVGGMVVKTKELVIRMTHKKKGLRQEV